MNHIEKRLFFYWISIFLMIILSPLAYFFEEAISESVVLVMVVFFLMIPIGIGYFSLVADIFKVFGVRLVFLVPLVLWPQGLALLLFFGPVAYLSYRTWQYISVRENIK